MALNVSESGKFIDPPIQFFAKVICRWSLAVHLAWWPRVVKFQESQHKVGTINQIYILGQI